MAMINSPPTNKELSVRDNVPERKSLELVTIGVHNLSYPGPLLPAKLSQIGLPHQLIHTVDPILVC